MALKILKFRTIEEAEHVLAGGIVGATAANKTFPLVGKTITFTNPAGSKAFTQPANQIPNMMTFQDVKSQLEAAIANLTVSVIGGRIGFIDDNGASVTLAKVDQDARAILGLSNPSGGVAISGKKINPPGGGSPYFVAFGTDNNTIYVMIEET